MSAVFRKELKSYFFTSTAWLFLGVYLALASLLFYLNNLLPRSSDFAPFLSMMSYVWMLLTPILVMRLFAGERQQMTDKLLDSSPLSDIAVVMGKYVAACTVMLLAVTLSLLYPILLSAYARVYPLEVLTGYLGFFLQGCAFIALDLLVTARMKNIAGAASLAFGVNLFVWLISLLTTSASLPIPLVNAIAFTSLHERFNPFLSAQLSPSNILFFLLFSLCMLLIATLNRNLSRAKTR